MLIGDHRTPSRAAEWRATPVWRRPWILPIAVIAVPSIERETGHAAKVKLVKPDEPWRLASS